MIDFTKPVETRNGIPVRILCTDGPNPTFPVIGIVKGNSGVTSWALDGSYLAAKTSSPNDLRNTLEKVHLDRWIVVFKNKSDEYYTTSYTSEKSTTMDIIYAESLGSKHIKTIHVPIDLVL
jgi:hypothetical protein